MATYNTFEELPVWKEALTLYKLVYKVIETSKIKSDFGMKEQIRRAAASVSNNIAEGFEQSNNKVFYNYLRIAKGSCGEVMNQAILCYEVKMIEEKDFSEIKKQAKKLSASIAGFMKYLKSKNNK